MAIKPNTVVEIKKTCSVRAWAKKNKFHYTQVTMLLAKTFNYANRPITSLPITAQRILLTLANEGYNEALLSDGWDVRLIDPLAAYEALLVEATVSTCYAYKNIIQELIDLSDEERYSGYIEGVGVFTANDGFVGMFIQTFHPSYFVLICDRETNTVYEVK